MGSRKQPAAEQYRHVEMARELSEQSGAESDLETRLPGRQRPPESGADGDASARRRSSAMKADLEELTYRLEEQNEVVAEASEQQAENEARAEAAESWKWMS
ncbi:hypothetical protein M8494_16230 [Serratia ureilytica]